MQHPTSSKLTNFFSFCYFFSYVRRLLLLLLLQTHSGHTRVPRDCKEFAGLGEFVARVKQQKHANKLRFDRVDKLNSIAMDWRF
jgi:Helicase associated domain